MKTISTLLGLLLVSSFSYGQLIINEVLYDPSNSGTNGDANGDGSYSQEGDSFIEFVNVGLTNFDAGNYEIWDDTSATGDLKFVVPAGTMVPPNGAMVVFGSGPLTGTFGNAIMLSADTSASNLSLNNSGEVIGIKDANGAWVLFFDSDALSNNPNESYTRFPDITGNFIQHEDSTTILFSPGTMTDGTPFSTNFVVETVAVSSAGVTSISAQSGTLQLSATVTPNFASDTTLTWAVSAGSMVATVDPSGLVTAVNNGSIWVSATSNDGTNIADSIEITVSNQNVSLAENSLKSLKLFPNPAQNYISLNTAGMDIDEIRLFHVTGILIDVFKGDTERISVGHLSAGTYLLVVKSGGDSNTLKFQKIK